MAVEEENSIIPLGEDSIQQEESNGNNSEIAESKRDVTEDSDTRLKANTEQWKYQEAVPNAPGEPPNPTPVLPDVDGVQTGLFLQQFTNSVNKALHKQHCTCNGKIYSSEDLYEKSNPALFRRSKSDIDYNQSHRRTVRLPRLRSDTSLVGGTTNDMVEETEKPPLQVQIERESKDFQLYEMHFDPFCNNHETVYDQDGEIRLPNIMDIHDLSGNSWKIIQEPKKGRDLKHGYSRFDRRVFSDAISEAEDEIKTKSAKSSKSMKRNVTSESNTSKRRFITVDISSATPNNSENEGSVLTASSESFNLPKMEPLCNSAPAHTPQIRSPPFVCDEMGRKALLWRYASAVRKGEITYRDYLQKVSEISSLYRDDNDNDGVNDDDSKRMKRELSPQQITGDIGFIKIPRADLDTNAENKMNVLHSLPSACERQCAATVKIETSFPPELEVLYSKAGLSVSNLTDSFSKSLPENFLDKEKELLRSEYPMYDWKVRQKFQQLPLKTGERNNNDITFGSVRVAQDGRRRAGIGQRDFGHTVKVFSNRNGLDQNVVSFRSSQLLDRKGKLIDIPETDSVKKMITEDGQSSCVSRGFLPNQPPTTPALTYASCSVPNIMETMEEEETGEEEEKNDEKIEDGSVIIEKDDIEPINATVVNHVTRTEICTAKSQKSERSWKEGFDGKMYKVSKERQLNIIIPSASAVKDRKGSFESKGDELSTISDVVPPNPHNSNENINEIGLSEEQQSKRNSVCSSSKVLPVKLLGAEDMLPDMQLTGLRGTLRRKSSSRSESSKHGKDTSPRPFSNAPAVSDSDRTLPVTLSTKHLVFVSPIE